MAQLDNGHPYNLQAQRFAEALKDQRFADAHAMLCFASRGVMSEADLREDYLRMIEYGDGPSDLCEVMIVDDGMPKRTSNDLAWAYFAICGPGFSEAVAAAIVDDSGEPKLRIEDWGRP